ncbi:Amidohydrolase 2 [Mycena kentingensis (nom. inval.)]|nr:Amidohydrolase 2 [Mycena kentingensis (nom. inval.)]
MTNLRRIDIHHHYFEPNKGASGNKVGWLTPPENIPWTPAISLRYMDASGIDVAILSFPALSTGSVSRENRHMARQRNVAMAEVCSAHPGRFGFFATLPFLNDIDGEFPSYLWWLCSLCGLGVLLEMAFALDELKADGISMSSCYGEGAEALYIGDERYDPIWRELDKRRAVVFIHGAQTPSSTPLPHSLLGIPTTEVPAETFKAAAHLVVTGRKRKYPGPRIILAHFGGSTPFLAARVAGMAAYMGCTLRRVRIAFRASHRQWSSSPDEILHDFSTFYFDSALSAHSTTLALMSSWVGPERVLFGTDFPAVSKETAGWYTKNVEDFYGEDDLKNIMSQNALNLFPKLAK